MTHKELCCRGISMLEFVLVENSLLVPCTNYLNSELLGAQLLKTEKLLKAFEIRKNNSPNTNQSEGGMWSAFTKEGISVNATKRACMEHQCLSVM